jgi:prolyl oligopeptidase
MQIKIIIGAAAITLLAACTATQKLSMLYPESKKDAVSEDFFGTKVADPYRWLEDPNSAETKAWVTAQNKVTFDHLDKIPFRQKVTDRLTELWNFERFGVPFEEGGKYYFWKNDGLQNQSVFYVQDSPEAAAKTVLDPNTLSAAGTTSIGGMTFSKDSRYMAYATSEGGSDWNTVYVKDMKTLENTADHLDWVKFSGMAWCGDGFFYSRYPEPSKDQALSKKNEFHALYYHKLGTKQADDQLVFVDKEHALRNVGGGTTEDEKYLILSQSESTSGEAVFLANLENAKGDFTKLKFTPISKDFEADYSIIDNVGDKFYVMTNNDAPNKRIIEIDFKNTAKSNWKTIVAEGTETMQGASLVGDNFLATYIKDAYSQIRRFDMAGKQLSDVKLPGIGTVGGFGGKREAKELFYSFVSFTTPTTIYRYDVANNSSTVFKAPKMGFDGSKYETKQVFYTSKDGTKVPMFVTHKKGLVLDGNNPTWLYGYGGFDISVQPAFKVATAVFLEQGGVYCVANIRGGGEYGEKWHKAGTKLQKQNVFDDFIGAAEYLIAQKYCNKNKLAIEGRSNGGLLVGACITQRPDLFKVAFPGVGVMDMLRYHKFTIGWAWASDYGKSDDDKAMFDYLYKYSPVHNCRKAAYPATMITTADHDDRVVPAHSFKFAAALQPANTGKNPTLIRIDTQAGHGAGKSTKMAIQEWADMTSFALYHMGVEFK